MKKHSRGSINKKMTLSLICLIIIPLIVIGVTMTEVVYSQELELNCRGYQEKMEWAKSQVDNAFLDAENIALTFYLDSSAQDFVKEKNQNSLLSQDVSNLLLEQTYNKDWYQSICITTEGKLLKQWSGGTLLTHDNQSYVEKAYSQDDHGFWTGPRYLENVLNPHRAYEGRVLTFYGKIFDYFYFHDVLGVVSVSISESYIQQLCAGSLAIQDGTHMIMDPNGLVLSSNDKSLLGKTYEDFGAIQTRMADEGGYFPSKINGRKCIVFSEASGKYDWYLVSIVPEASLSHDNQLSIVIILLCVGLCIVFGIAFGFLQRKTVIRPLTQLADKMSHLYSEETESRGEESTKEEIDMLHRAFDRMEHNINEMIQKNYVSEIYRKETEIRMLLSQINPHFLYNTLDSIYWLAAQNRDYTVAEQIATLSDIFRHSLRTGNEFATLASEIEFIEKYVYMMRVQSSNEIEFIVDIDEMLMDIQIPKLLLQPLVENSFLHGIKEKREGACIIISAETMNEKLCLTVSDNGVGVDEQAVRRELQNPEAGSSAFALKNVNKRIQLICGDAYGLEFHSTRGSGTTVIIQLPLNMEQKSDEVTS